MQLKSFHSWQVVYKRYASLYFVMGIDSGDNELITLEIVHHYVEVLDRYFGNVCELDLIFNFHKVGLHPYILCTGSVEESHISSYFMQEKTSSISGPHKTCRKRSICQMMFWVNAGIFHAG